MRQNSELSCTQIMDAHAQMVEIASKKFVQNQIYKNDIAKYNIKNIQKCTIYGT